jgi:VanZ family protein
MARRRWAPQSAFRARHAAITPRQAALLLAWHWLPVLVWMALILVLSGRSDLPVRSNPVTGEVAHTTYWSAKVAHVVEYAVLGGLLFRAATARGGGFRLAPLPATVGVVAAATIFGAVDELRQSFVPGREPRLSDVVLDGASALGMVAVVLIRRRLRDGERFRPREAEMAASDSPTGRDNP